MPEADDIETGNESGNENENANIRLLREKAAKADEATAAHAALQREVAFLKAGIDTDSKLGKLLFKSYEGDLTDIEALKTEATELGAIKGSEPAAEAGAGSESEADLEPTGTSERRALASGAPADTGEDVHPIESAKAVYDSAMSRGETWEVAAGEMFHSLAESAAKGDQRVIIPDHRA